MTDRLDTLVIATKASVGFYRRLLGRAPNIMVATEGNALTGHRFHLILVDPAVDKNTLWFENATVNRLDPKGTVMRMRPLWQESFL
ncbi:hypothetical protein RPALISO_210 [Ruegeria phage RpAliso]|nr:hypothetical protein RPALISO_210 [Ruegeria phage RpAliso]